MLPILRVLGVPAASVPSVRRATCPAGLWPQLHDGARRPGARSACWFPWLERSRSTSPPRSERPRRRKLLPVRSAIGRVAGSAGAPEVAEGRERPPGAGQQPGGATAGRWSRKRWTRQQRLPSRSALCQPFASTRIDAEIALTTASSAIPLIRDRRAEQVAAAISGGIPADGCLSAPKNDPRDVGASGGLVTTDWTGYGDN